MSKMIKVELIDTLIDEIKNDALSFQEVPVGVAVKRMKSVTNKLSKNGWTAEDIAALYSERLGAEIDPRLLRTQYARILPKKKNMPVPPRATSSTEKKEDSVRQNKDGASPVPVAESESPADDETVQEIKPQGAETEEGQRQPEHDIPSAGISSEQKGNQGKKGWWG